jgi:hypothetical protein
VAALLERGVLQVGRRLWLFYGAFVVFIAASGLCLVLGLKPCRV